MRYPAELTPELLMLLGRLKEQVPPASSCLGSDLPRPFWDVWDEVIRLTGNTYELVRRDLTAALHRYVKPDPDEWEKLASCRIKFELAPDTFRKIVDELINSVGVRARLLNDAITLGIDAVGFPNDRLRAIINAAYAREEEFFQESGGESSLEPD